MNEQVDNQVKVCVVIVSYNFVPWLEKCMDSLQHSTIPVTILVIDNNSQDLTCQILREKYPEVILIENKENLGFGKANNQGMGYAIKNGYDYVFLLNQDAWLQPDTLEKLVVASKNNSTFGILSPIHLNASGKSLDFGFSTYTHTNNIEDFEKYNSELIEFPFINAAMWLLPVMVVQSVGGFLPIFSHYGEDVNFCQRLRKHQYKIGVVNSAFGYHDRAHRKVSRKKYFYSEFVYLLTEAVNPNYSPLQAVAYSVFATAKKCLKSLFLGRFSDSKEYLRIIYKIVSKSGDIHDARINTRKGNIPLCNNYSTNPA